MGINLSRLEEPSDGSRVKQRRSHAAALWEAVKIALDSIWTHKLRSVLTLIGIIIGVASVVVVGGAIDGFGTYVSDRLSSAFASNTFIVSRFVNVRSYEEFERILKTTRNIYPEDMHAVQERCKGCDAITPTIRSTDDIKRGNRSFFDASVSGVNEDMPRVQLLDLQNGRFFSTFDVEHARNYAVVGSQIRDELFGAVDPLGKTVKLGGEDFVIIGVEVENGNMMGQSLDNNIYIPYTTFLKKYGLRRSIQFRVRAPSEAALDPTQDEVRQILRAKHKLKPNRNDDFGMMASNAMQEMVGQLTGAIAMVVTPITLISLVVGGIVVMNIMLMTVTERTVEIGTRKAVGAKRSDILMQFLIESALLASLGGVLGIILSYGVGAVIAATTPVPMDIGWGYIMMAILTSGGIGVISGIYPAHRASKLNPIVALTREG